VEACPVDALSINGETEAVSVDKERCIGCGLCIDACPGKVPYLHPSENHAVICDLCGGDPRCVKACSEGKWNALRIIEKKENYTFKLYAKTPEEITKDLALQLYGEQGREMI